MKGYAVLNSVLAACCFVAALIAVLIAHDEIESRFSPTRSLLVVAVVLITAGILLLRL